MYGYIWLCLCHCFDDRYSVNSNFRQPVYFYIEINVPFYPIAISCKGNYYYRSGSATQKLTGIELESFILRKRGVSWDNVPHPLVKIEDLDQNAIQKFKDLACKKHRIDESVLSEDTSILLDKLHLINHGYLTNAALLLFSKDPERYFTGAFIKVGFFETNADLLYQDEVRGSLFEQVDKAIELIYFKYMKAKISYSGLQRIERYFVEPDAMREAILNAVIHKQYESGIPIQISVYKDKLYIGNTGILPNNWTAQNLYGKHSSQPYNPNVAHVFYLAGHIESWGRGVEKMFESCVRNNLPTPIYHVNPNDIMIQFNAPKELVIDNFALSISRVTDGVTDGVTDEVTDKEMEVIELLIEDPAYSYVELANKLKLSKKTVAERIKQLKDKKLITRVGTSKRGYWKINL